MNPCVLSLLLCLVHAACLSGLRLRWWSLFDWWLWDLRLGADPLLPDLRIVLFVLLCIELDQVTAADEEHEELAVDDLLLSQKIVHVALYVLLVLSLENRDLLVSLELTF